MFLVPGEGNQRQCEVSLERQRHAATTGGLGQARTRSPCHPQVPLIKVYVLDCIHALHGGKP